MSSIFSKLSSNMRSLQGVCKVSASAAAVGITGAAAAAAYVYSSDSASSSSPSSSSSSSSLLKLVSFPLYSKSLCSSDTSSSSTGSSNIGNDVDELSSVRPDLNAYTRIDENVDMVAAIKDNLKIDVSKKDYRTTHAIYGNLMGDDRIEAYEVYKKNDSDEVKCILKFGNKLNGYPGIVHGGITALLFDNCFGWLFISMKIPKAVTANLTINYKKPIFANNAYVITTKLSKLEGRKLTMEGTLSDKNGAVLAESTSLFIVLSDQKK